MCPTINEEITWPAVQVRTKMISARRLPSSDGTVWDTGNPSVLCSSGRPIADSRLLEMLSVWLFLKGSSSTLALEGGTSVAVICRDWASADASAIRLIAISLSGPRSGHGTEASALLSRGFAGSDVFLLNAECSVVSVLRSQELRSSEMHPMPTACISCRAIVSLLAPYKCRELGDNGFVAIFAEWLQVKGYVNFCEELNCL
jgi:hypothetical protein